MPYLFGLVLLIPCVAADVFRVPPDTVAGAAALVALAFSIGLPLGVGASFLQVTPVVRTLLLGGLFVAGLPVVWSSVVRATELWRPALDVLNLLALGVASVAVATWTSRYRHRFLVRSVLFYPAVVAAVGCCGYVLAEFVPSLLPWAQGVALVMLFFYLLEWFVREQRAVAWYALVAAAALGLVYVLDAVYREQRLWLTGVFLVVGLCALRKLARKRMRSRPALALLALTSLGTVAAFWVADVLIQRDPSALRIARDQGVMQVVLTSVMRLSDFDGDGYGVLFGQSDCDPLDPERSPGMHEQSSTAVDDNCLESPAVDEFAVSRELHARPKRVAGDIILIVVDTLRYDTAQSASLRNLRELERSSVRFTRAYATSSFTVQSVFSVLTGGLAPQSGYAWKSRHDAYPTRVPTTLFERLRSLGFDTGAAGLIGHFFEAWRLERGARVVERTYMNAPSSVTEEQALRVWSKLDPDRRRFLYVHYIDVHGYADDQEPYEDAYLDRAVRTDASIGRLIGKLPTDAVVIVTSDHGESFGLHGRRGHSTQLSDETLHVPLIVRLPGVAPRTQQHVTSLLALAPTIDAFARHVPNSGRGFYLCLGKPPCHDMPAPAALERPNAHVHSLTVGRSRVYRDLATLTTQAFDLNADPLEQQPLPVNPALLDQMRIWEEHGMDPSGRPVVFQ